VLARRGMLAAPVLRPYLFVYEGDEAVRHLCRVAAGIDSMVVGETQIVAQLKRAVDEARREGTAGRILLRLASTALGAGKRARPKLPTTIGPTSVAGAAVRAIGGIAALHDRSVVVVGAGETAVDVFRCLAGARPRRLVLVNRTLRHALPRAARYGAAVASWEALGVVVADADVVFACTSASTPVIEARHLAGTPDRPRVFVDLGVPRNVDPEVSGVPGARVIDVDTLGAARTWDDALDDAPNAAADAVIGEWAERFDAWRRSAAVVPTISGLRAHADALCEEEVRRAIARLGPLDAREEAVVRAMASRLVNKLLHRPVSTLAMRADEPELLAATRQLFGMPAESHPVADVAPASALDAQHAAERTTAAV
jgi:glutamyl-tRNA reductase